MVFCLIAEKITGLHKCERLKESAAKCVDAGEGKLQADGGI